MKRRNFLKLTGQATLAGVVVGTGLAKVATAEKTASELTMKARLVVNELLRPGLKALYGLEYELLVPCETFHWNESYVHKETVAEYAKRPNEKWFQYKNLNEVYAQGWIPKVKEDGKLTGIDGWRLFQKFRDADIA